MKKWLIPSFPFKFHFSFQQGVVNSIKTHTHKLKFALFNCEFCSTLMSISTEQMAWVLKGCGECSPPEGRVEAAAGRWSLLDFTLEIVWVGSGTEHIKNILWKKTQSRECELWELHKWGQSGFRTGRKSAFLKCYHIWSSSYSNFHRCGVTMTHLRSARLLGDGQRDLGERQDIDVRTGVEMQGDCRRGHVCWIFLSLCILKFLW